MAIGATCPANDCPTLGVDAVDLDRYIDVLTGGGLLLYDRREDGDVWIESDLYHPRASCV